MNYGHINLIPRKSSLRIMHQVNMATILFDDHSSTPALMHAMPHINTVRYGYMVE